MEFYGYHGVNPEEKVQGKNENFGALRALDATAEEEKTRGKFFDYRSVGPGAPQGCFSPKNVCFR